MSRLSAVVSAAVFVAGCQGFAPPGSPAQSCVPQQAKVGSPPVFSGEIADSGSPGPVKIYRDRFGVPSVFAEDERGAFFGFGFAQAEDHLAELLFLVLQVRGSLSEAFGARCLESDRIQRTLGIARDANAGMGRVPPALRREVLASFAAGVNSYARRARPQLPGWVEVALPVTEADIVALHGFFGLVLSLTNDPYAFGTLLALMPWGGEPGTSPSTASNAFALAPRRTASGLATVGLNPHIHLSHPFLLYEARLRGGRINARGSTFFGLPLFLFGHTAATAWGVTINYTDTFDRYMVLLDPSQPGRYLFDGTLRALAVREERIRVLNDGEVSLTIEESVHGPIVARLSRTHAVALAWATRGEVGFAEQLYRMNTASSVAEFDAAVSLRQAPNYSFIAADSGGALLYAHLGRVARREERVTVDGGPVGCGPLEVDWISDNARSRTPCASLGAGGLGAIPGWTRDTLWGEPLPSSAFPRERDPSRGWLQMANSPPWGATVPSSVARCEASLLIAPCIERFPYIANVRVARFTERLNGESRISFDEAQNIYLDAYVTAADYPPLPGSDTCLDAAPPVQEGGRARCGYLPRLFAAWERGRARLSDARRTVLARGVDLFRAWDRRATRESGAAALFQDFVFALPAEGASDDEILQALELAIAWRERRSGRIDPPWGTAHRLRRPVSPLRSGEAPRVPVSGTWQFLGTLNAYEGPYRPFIGSVRDGTAQMHAAEDGIVDVAFGTVRITLVELGPEGPRAWSAGVFGASEDPASPHFVDQARELIGVERLRRVPFTEEETRREMKSLLRLH